MVARDVEHAIQSHDYIEAMRVLRAGLQTDAGLNGLTVGSVRLLLRPSVGLAAAITGDEEALRLIDSLAQTFSDTSAKHQVKSKTASNWTYLAMVRWLNDELALRSCVSVTELADGARERGFRNLNRALIMLERHKVLSVRDGIVHSGTRFDEPAIDSVPPFNEYFSTRDDLDEQQAAFYEGSFKPAFIRGSFVDVGNNLSYGYVLMGELVAEHGYENLARLREMFVQAADTYPGTSLMAHATDWAADTYFLSGDYQLGYDLLTVRGSIDLPTYIGIAEELVDSRVTGQMAWGWTTSARLQPYGMRHKEAVLTEIERLLDGEHASRGRSIVSDIWHALAIDRSPEQPAPSWVINLLGERVSEVELGRYLHFMHLYGGRGRDSFRGLRASTPPQIQWPAADAIGLATYSTSGFNLIVREYLHGLFRTAENNIRESSGIPRIGEGWVSEVELYRQLREEFAETRVIHQGRPRWLGRQSIDIFLPQWSIAVEYQGEQHHRPVGRFGGEAAFATQQERDERKRLLCAENDVTLIEVMPGYEFAEVVCLIRRARSAASADGDDDNTVVKLGPDGTRR